MSATTFSHVGITVPDIWAAIDWYGDVLGCRHLMGPRVLEPARRASAETGQLLGPGFDRAYQAHLLTADGVGLELFQFVEPPTDEARHGIAYRRRGTWHVCFVVGDIAATVARIAATGGRQLSPVFDFVPGRPHQLVYCEDPWSTTLELMSAPYSVVFGGWPQPGMTEPTAWLTRDGDVVEAVAQPDWAGGQGDDDAAA
jgi:catechol 2,3-dioxygenase-like lactoylglutathione lyase family enzyme